MDFNDEQLEGEMGAELPLDMGDGDSESEELDPSDEEVADAFGMTIKNEDEFAGEEETF